MFAGIENSSTFAAVIKKRDVAQLASAPRSGRGGRKFESSHPDLKKGESETVLLFFVCEKQTSSPLTWLRIAAIRSLCKMHEARLQQSAVPARCMKEDCSNPQFLQAA